MLTSSRNSPGVYINEPDGFPNSVMPVATAVPAFIGYTVQAEYQGKSCLNQAQKISSFADFQARYMLPNPPAPADPATQYNPQYYLVAQTTPATRGAAITLNGTQYAIVPDPNTLYYLYNSVRLFYLNGGGEAYIVSVGTYGSASGHPGEVGAQTVNPNVQLADLQRGLALLQNESEPTLYVCPDAVLLSPEENSTLMQNMLQQASQKQSAVCLFDIIGGEAPDPVMYVNDIETFRDCVGVNGLDYGAAYYPFIGTRVMQASELNFTNLFGGDRAKLAALINPPSAFNPTVATLLAQAPDGALPLSQLNLALTLASEPYAQLFNCVLACANMLPTGGAMAGVYATNDSLNGVWHSPANTGIVDAVSLPMNISDTQQANLFMGVTSGISINALRIFPGRGILIWGARTLDGNSQDWRYIAIRRTLIFLEQSIKVAVRGYAFEPNTSNTWATVRSVISNFLFNMWKQGALQGATPGDAFQVSCGLGETMTGEDILNDFMNVTVKVAVIRPAEFIAISLQQKMAVSG